MGRRANGKILRAADEHEWTRVGKKTTVELGSSEADRGVRPTRKMMDRDGEEI
jgi:hypothetical protein